LPQLSWTVKSLAGDDKISSCDRIDTRACKHLRLWHLNPVDTTVFASKREIKKPNAQVASSTQPTGFEFFGPRVKQLNFSPKLLIGL